MKKRRVVITGLGVVSPVGNNVNDSWSNIINGISGICATLAPFNILNKHKASKGHQSKGGGAQGLVYHKREIERVLSVNWCFDTSLKRIKSSPQ